MNDAVTPERVVPLLRGRLGTPYIYAARCESTQRLLTDAEPHGAVAACDEQTAGRGRLGRPWQAPAGTALLCSILLRRPADRNPAELSLVSAARDRRNGRGGYGPRRTHQVAERRAAGRTEGGGNPARGPPEHDRARIGLNVNQTEAQLPDRPQFPAGSLFTADGAHRDRAPILVELLDRVELLYERWASAGLARASFRTSPGATRSAARSSRSALLRERRPVSPRVGARARDGPAGGAWSRPAK